MLDPGHAGEMTDLGWLTAGLFKRNKFFRYYFTDVINSYSMLIFASSGIPVGSPCMLNMLVG